MEDFNKFIQTKINPAIESMTNYLPNILLAIGMLVIGFWLIKKLVDSIMKYVQRTKLSIEIRPLLKSFFIISLKVLLIFSVMGILGIEISHLFQPSALL